MADYRPVFHLTDEVLFETFLAAIPHRELIRPLLVDAKLRDRYFRGFRIDNTRPDLPRLLRAYRKELLDRRSRQLGNHLCNAWIREHLQPVRDALAHLEVPVERFPEDEWLGSAHEALAEQGHLNAAVGLVNALAPSHEADIVRIVVSLLCYDCEAQRELQQAVNRGLADHSSDPKRQAESLTREVQEALERMGGVVATGSSKRADLESFLTQTADKQRELEIEIDQLPGKLRATEADLAKRETELRELDGLVHQLRDDRGKIQSKKEKLERKLEHLATQATEGKENRQQVLRDLKDTEEGERQRLAKLQERLRVVQEELTAAQSASQSPRARDRELPPQAPVRSARERLSALLEACDLQPSLWSACTAELVGQRCVGAPAKSPEATERTPQNADSVAAGIAYELLGKQREWSQEELAEYAYWRSLSIQMSGGNGIDAAVSGLYHAADSVGTRISAAALIMRIIETTTGTLPTQPFAENASSFARLLDSAAMDPATAPSLGALQVKLALAGAELLPRLYESLEGRSRLLFKRALVTQLHGTVEVDETDPTHEVLDVVASTLASLAGPIGQCVRTWQTGANLQIITDQRRRLLAALSKIAGTLDADSTQRIESFKELLGKQLSRALKDRTPTSYEAFLASLLNLVESEISSPGWIGSHYLLPLSLAVGRAAIAAESEALKLLRSSLSFSLEKAHQPIGEASRTIRLGILLGNTGNTEAHEVEATLMPSLESEEYVSIEQAEVTVSAIAPDQRLLLHVEIQVVSPAPAVELEYLLSWSDTSAEKRSATGRLKLVAQTGVGWDQATQNPYSLRSIIHPTRLHGRTDDLARLRRGIRARGSFCLTGQKRVGKTSVARVLNAELQKEGECIATYLTLGELDTRSAASAIASMGEALLEQCPAEFREELEPLRRNALGDGGTVDGKRLFRRLRSLPDSRFLTFLDDFDELPEHLYLGPQGDELFLFFRTLIDQGFSFVFVGSEQLPEIIRRQGEKLNQVTRIPLDYLSGPDSVANLVTEPAKPVLEYSQEAIVTIDGLCAGNPYYATMLCMRIFDDMTARQDHYVAASDVDRCAHLLLSEDVVSNYQHLWKDGVLAKGEEAENLQYVNALILIALAGLERSDASSSMRSVLSSDTLVALEPRLVEHRCHNLSERRVVEIEDEQVSIRIPMFSNWLAGRGSAEVRASFGERDLVRALTSGKAGVPDSEIVEVTGNLTYKGERVNEVRVKAWLMQFGSVRNQNLAFMLLKRLVSVGYYGDARILRALKSIHSRILADQTATSQWSQKFEKRRRHPTNVFVTHLDAVGKSGSGLLYLYRQFNKLPKAQTGALDAAVTFLAAGQKASVVVLVDDFVGTGNSLVEGFRRFETLAAEGGVDLRPHGIVASVVAGTARGVEHVRSETADSLRVFVGDELIEKDMAFSSANDIFESEADREDAVRMCQAIGEQLEPRQPLGYGGCQALVAFANSCPNNTLPIFYQSGRRYEGSEWVPLFPRY